MNNRCFLLLDKVLQKLKVLVGYGGKKLRRVLLLTVAAADAGTINGQNHKRHHGAAFVDEIATSTPSFFSLNFHPCCPCASSSSLARSLHSYSVVTRVAPARDTVNESTHPSMYHITRLIVFQHDAGKSAKIGNTNRNSYSTANQSFLKLNEP